MRATVFHGVNDISVEDVERPRAGVGEAVIRITLTTICGTDLHIVRGEYPVKSGLVIGHEPVGVIDDFGNTINGAQAEYLLVPDAQANLARIPDELTDEQVVLLADIASTGFSGAESAQIKIGDAVVIFAQGPIGLCATAGAKLMGASFIIAVDGDRNRLEMARKMGADVTLDYRELDVVAEVRKVTGGGADAAIEALGTQETFESALRSLRPGGTLSILGVYSGKVQIPYEAFSAGLGDYRIITTLCPGGKERMRRLMEVVRRGRVDLTPLLTHTFSLNQIKDAYDLFGNRAEGVIKVAIRP